VAKGTVRSVVIGGAIALLVFGTVPLAQVAARRAAAPHAAASGTTAHPLGDRIGAGLTSFVAMHTAVSVALSATSR